MSWVFVLLGLAICFVWLPDFAAGRWSIPAWAPPFLIALLLALRTGVVEWPGLVGIVVLITCARLSLVTSAPWRGAFTFVVVALCLLFALHLFPGFNSPKLFDAIRLSEDAGPYTQYLNFDKGTAGLIALWAYSARATSLHELGRVLRVLLPIALGNTVVVMALGVALGYAHLDIKVPGIAATFLVTNLLFTCVPEEAFFRGFIQERLMRLAGERPLARWLPVLISALLFGLAHAANVTFVVLATVAGLGYSIAYAATRRIEAAVLAHFAVNATQFLGFTYPYLARS